MAKIKQKYFDMNKEELDKELENISNKMNKDIAVIIWSAIVISSILATSTIVSLFVSYPVIVDIILTLFYFVGANFIFGYILSYSHKMNTEGNLRDRYEELLTMEYEKNRYKLESEIEKQFEVEKNKNNDAEVDIKEVLENYDKRIKLLNKFKWDLIKNYKLHSFSKLTKEEKRLEDIRYDISELEDKGVKSLKKEFIK